MFAPGLGSRGKLRTCETLYRWQRTLSHTPLLSAGEHSQPWCNHLGHDARHRLGLAAGVVLHPQRPQFANTMQSRDQHVGQQLEITYETYQKQEACVNGESFPISGSPQLISFLG